MVAFNKGHQCRQPPDDDLVDQQHACPLCGERHQDRLVWIDDQRVRCSNCQAEFEPGRSKP